MGKPKNYLEVFYFNRKERLGLLLLSMLIVITAFLRSSWFHKNQPKFSLHWEVLPVTPIDSSKYVELPKRNLQPFDPNSIQKEELLSYGVPNKAVNNWLRYREKGGQFRKVKDVEKIYNLPAKTFQRIKPFLRFPKQKKKLNPTPKWTSHNSTSQKKEFQPFTFDPNQADLQTLKQLGLPTKTAQQIIRYRERGGKFRSKPDLKKIYSLSTDDYIKLEPYIQIIPITSKQKEKTYQKISINTPKVSDWEQFRGIGPTYAQRIITYGEKLGGYYKAEQLYEVWGLPDSIIQQNLSHIDVRGELTLLSASKASYKTLIQHPYLQSKQVQLMIRFREAHDGYIAWKDIIDLPCFTQEELDRLAPYILEAQWP